MSLVPLRCTPGYDPVTGMVAGGAQVVGFTTGRGTVSGFLPAPTVKIASHHGLYDRMPDDMDFDAGDVMDGVGVEEVGKRLFEEIVAVASGKPTKSELHGAGEEEFAPWVVGSMV